jgi:hypothetical protein
MDKCGDWDNPKYYNIHVFKAIESKGPVGVYALPHAAGGAL